MTTTNTYGRQVVVPLTNKSGGGVIAGDVVVVGTANNDAFTTTTSAAFTGTVGIAQETIADNATGRVLISGYAALVNTTASVTRQNFGTTSTTVKKAVDAGASRTAGTFCQFLTGGTTPDAIVYPSDLGSGSGTGTLTTVKDEGSNLSTAVVSMDFVGAGVAATGTTAVTVTIPGAVGNLWKMSISSSVTLTNATNTTITFDRTDIDGGSSVIDLANDRFVVPATGFYQIICDWLWEGTAPVAPAFMNVTVGGTDTVLFRVTNSGTFATDSGYNATQGMSLSSGAFVKMTINPGAQTGVTARGNASARLSTSMTLIRIT